MLDPGFRYAIEVRHTSWFDNKDFYKLLSTERLSGLESVRHDPKPHRELTSDFIYLRFIGDRSIDEKDFGVLQKDRL